MPRLPKEQVTPSHTHQNHCYVQASHAEGREFESQLSQTNDLQS